MKVGGEGEQAPGGQASEFCPCFVTGEAVGTAAALAAKRGCTSRELPHEELRKQLLANGVYI